MTRYDHIERCLHSLVQHGPSNQRVYLMKLDHRDVPTIIPYLNRLAIENHYTKIFAKIPKAYSELFFKEGYCQEAVVPGLYNGEEDGLFLGHYLDPRRASAREPERIKKNLALAAGQVGSIHNACPRSKYHISRAGPDEVIEMAELYRTVFPSYPFPISEPEYLRNTMASQVCYFAARYDGVIVALAAAEMDKASQNAEVTDFATLPKHRGKRLAMHLLWHIERSMRELGFIITYSIARALSAGMNITFARMGYRWGGTLINNTDIHGQIESMNVWHKNLYLQNNTNKHETREQL